MIRFLATFLACSVLATAVWADVDAVINGPTEAKVGDLIVLSGRDSVGDNTKWVEPQKIQTMLCGDGKDLAFATGTPGTYSFILIVADKQATIDYATHTVVVTGTLPVDPVDPPKPEPEPTDPPDDLQELVKFSRDLSTKLEDSATSEALSKAIQLQADEISKQCQSGLCPGLDAAKQQMVKTIEFVLLLRSGPSRDKDWLTGWRLPVNEKLKTIDTSTVDKYLTAMRALSAGLD